MATPQPGLQDNTYLDELLRRSDASQQSADGMPTVTILRYTQSAAGTPARGIPPTMSLVSGLTNLPCTVSALGEYGAEVLDSNGVLLQDGEREFGLLDVPAAGGAGAGVVLGTDVLSFEGHLYRAVRGGKTHSNDPPPVQSRVVGKLMA